MTMVYCCFLSAKEAFYKVYDEKQDILSKAQDEANELALDAYNKVLQESHELHVKSQKLLHTELIKMLEDAGKSFEAIKVTQKPKL